MNYDCVIPARFLARPNRFIAQVELQGRVETVHVKNTGRCKELLLPGATVYLAQAQNAARKTKYDLICVEKALPDGGRLLINLDSQVVNNVAEEWLRSTLPPDAVLRREVGFGSSRFDFLITQGAMQAFLEVKGVTLEEDGVVRFPDAPTLRGVKHLRELQQAKRQGYGAIVLFVVQMRPVRCFQPNERTHPEFAQALCDAAAAGVEIRAIDCCVTPDSIVPESLIPVELWQIPT